MSGSIGPHKPKEGWALRWFVQAAQLSLRTPAAFGLIAVWLLVAGAGYITLAEIIPGLWGIVAGSLLLKACSVIVLLTALQMIMQQDGRGRLSFSQVFERGIPIIKAVLFIETIFIVLLLIMYLTSQPSTPSDTVSVDMLGMTLKIGQMVTFGVHTTTLLVMPLWIPASAGIALGLIEARQASGVMFTKMPSVWFAAAFVPMASGPVVSGAPIYISLPVVFLLISWLYVAAREVFGGISENGEQEKEARLSHV